MYWIVFTHLRLVWILEVIGFPQYSFNKNFIPFLSVGLYTSNHLGDIKVKQNFINQNSFSTISNKKNSSHAEISLGLLSNNIDNAKFNFLTKGKFSNEFSDLSFNFQYNKKF